jgi:hypothetical protein
MYRACSTTGKKRKLYRILVREPEGRKPLGRPKRSCEDNIEMYLGEIAWGGTDWIHLARDGEECKVRFNMVIYF